MRRRNSQKYRGEKVMVYPSTTLSERQAPVLIGSPKLEELGILKSSGTISIPKRSGVYTTSLSQLQGIIVDPLDENRPYEYALLYKKRAKFPPIEIDVVDGRVTLIDGHHRLAGARIAKVPSIDVVWHIQTARQNPHKTRLVPKEKVRMKGFDRKKTAIVEPEIPHVLALIEDLVGRNLLFPTPIRPMTRAEFENGRSTVDSGHPMGAGHGQYDTILKEVAINGNMEPFDLITNVFHENLHHARPDLSEEVVRDTTGQAMLYLYGEYNLGRPYAEERRRNPRRNRKSETRDSKGRLIPQKYLAQYKGKRLKARIEEIEQRRDEYEAALGKYGDEDRFPRTVLTKLYRPFETDKGVVSKKSNYTKEADKRGFGGDLKQKQRAASHYYGGTIPLEVLETVMNRGRAAWASGGHRAGQTPESWGYARVNSFLVGGKTFWTTDADQARQLPKAVAMNIAENSVLGSSLSVLWD